LNSIMANIQITSSDEASFRIAREGRGHPNSLDVFTKYAIFM
jgi:hypothetical protein